MKSSLIAKVASATVLAIALATACGGESDSGSEAGEPLRVAVSADLSSLDPIKGSSGTDHVLLYPMYDTLISFNETMEPQPGLAQEWEQVSPTELKLTLREDVTFHDGESFDAEAVKFNLERAASEDSNIQADVAAVEEVIVDDPSNVTIKLGQANSSFLMALADRAGMMVSPRAADSGELETTAVGTGPFSFVSWNRGNALQVEQFDDYWDAELERSPGITFTVLPDPRTRVTSLQSGQQDVALDLSPSDAETIENADGLELEQTPRFQLQTVYFNTELPELADPDVRQALSMAINRETVLRSAYFDRGTATSGFMPTDYWAEPPASVDTPYDPDAARELLAEAGATDLSFDLMSNSDASTIRIAEILKDQWEEIGVTVNIVPREIVQAVTDFFVDQRAPALLSLWTGRPDPAMTYRSVFTEGAFYNAGGVAVPGIDEALAESDAATTQDDRVPGMQAAAQAVFDDTPVAPIAFLDALVGRTDTVSGFTSNLLGKPNLSGVTVD